MSVRELGVEDLVTAVLSGQSSDKVLRHELMVVSKDSRDLQEHISVEGLPNTVNALDSSATNEDYPHSHQLPP